MSYRSSTASIEGPTSLGLRGRRTVRVVIVSALAMITALGSARSAHSDALLTPGARVIEVVAQRVLKYHHLPSLSLGIRTRDGSEWLRAWGFANVGARVAARPESVYPTASLVKPMTALALLSALADSGGANPLDTDQLGRVLNDPAVIADHLPAGLVDALAMPTVSDLLTHAVRIDKGPGTDGRQVWGLGEFTPLPDLVARCRVAVEANSTYCNDCFLVAGYVLGSIEKLKRDGVEHGEVESALQKYLWDRLGMNSTRIAPSAAMIERMAHPYQWSKRRHVPKPHVRFLSTCSMGAFTTVPDLLALLSACLSDGIASEGPGLAPAVVRQATLARGATPGQSTEFHGQGWQRYVADSRDLIWKDGFEANTRGWMVGDLGTGSGVGVLTNSSGDGDAGKALSRLVRLILDVADGRTSPTNFELPAALADPVAQFAGEYDASPGGAVDRVRNVDGLWFLELPGELAVLFHQIGDAADVLTLFGGWREPKRQIRVTRGGSGIQVTGFASLGPEGTTWTRRSSGDPVPSPPDLSAYAGRWTGILSIERTSRGEDGTPESDAPESPEPLELDVRAEFGGRAVIVEDTDGAIGGESARVLRANQAGVEVEFDFCPYVDPIRLTLRPVPLGESTRLEGSWRQGAAVYRVGLVRATRGPDGDLAGVWEGVLEDDGERRKVRVGSGPAACATSSLADASSVATVTSARWRGDLVDFTAQVVGSPAQEFVGRLRGDGLNGTTKGPLGCGVFSLHRRRR
jgi:CubicO group peptidase (beta-lactamase class C family)